MQSLPSPHPSSTPLCTPSPPHPPPPPATSPSMSLFTHYSSTNYLPFLPFPSPLNPTLKFTHSRTHARTHAHSSPLPMSAIPSRLTSTPPSIPLDPHPSLASPSEAKTVLAPSLGAELNLIPQDIGDVRFGSSSALQALRRNYLLDHLLTESLAPSDPRLPSGVSLNTASGKDVTFIKDENGK